MIQYDENNMQHDGISAVSTTIRIPVLVFAVWHEMLPLIYMYKLCF